MFLKVSMIISPQEYMAGKHVQLLTREDKEAALIAIKEYLIAISGTLPHTRVADNVIAWTDALIDSYIG